MWPTLRMFIKNQSIRVIFKLRSSPTKHDYSPVRPSVRLSVRWIDTWAKRQTSIIVPLLSIIDGLLTLWWSLWNCVCVCLCVWVSVFEALQLNEGHLVAKCLWHTNLLRVFLLLIVPRLLLRRYTPPFSLLLISVIAAAAVRSISTALSLLIMEWASELGSAN